MHVHGYCHQHYCRSCQEADKRPTHSIKKVQEAKQAMKAAKRAARQGAFCTVTTSRPACKQPSPAAPKTVGKMLPYRILSCLSTVLGAGGSCLESAEMPAWFGGIAVL